MRLWSKDILKFLPKSQILAQNRELGSIFKKQDNHMSLNFIYDYDKVHLLHYTISLWKEMIKRGYTIKQFDNFNNYFAELLPYNLHTNNYKEYVKNFIIIDDIFPDKFTDRYLIQNFFNLQEKADEKQKDFSKEQYEKLELFMKDRGLI